MIILGIDASSTCTGWAVIESDDESIIAKGEFDLKSYKKKSAPTKFLEVVYDNINKVCKEHKPSKIYIEDVYLRNVSTIKMLSKVRGVIELAGIHNGLYTIHPMASSHIRKLVLGQGNLDKDKICSILEKRYSIPLATPGYDTSDALLVAIAGAMETKENAVKKR